MLRFVQFLKCVLFLLIVHPVVIKNGTYAWGHGEEEGKPVLKNLNMTVEKGSLVAVVGTVGAGKSSLCSAILGEMEKQSGTLNVKVRISMRITEQHKIYSINTITCY